jgi:hypothetical protein
MVGHRVVLLHGTVRVVRMRWLRLGRGFVDGHGQVGRAVGVNWGFVHGLNSLLN